MLRELEKGDGCDLPFSPGGVAYRPGSDPDSDRSVQDGGEQGDDGSGDRYGLLGVYEFCAAEYGWTAHFIEHNVTDEQFYLYVEKAAKRRKAQAFAELDRLVSGTSWGVAIAFDQKGRSARKWQQIRNRQQRESGHAKGLSGEALHQAVMAIAATDSSLVKIEQRGA